MPSLIHGFSRKLKPCACSAACRSMRVLYSVLALMIMVYYDIIKMASETDSNILFALLIMSKSKTTLDAIRVAQALFFLNAAIWFLLGILSLVSLPDRYPDPNLFHSKIANFMFGNAGAMLLCAVFIGRLKKNFYFFAVALLFINIIFTITDQFGAVDLITLLIDLLLLGILIRVYKKF